MICICLISYPNLIIIVILSFIKCHKGKNSCHITFYSVNYYTCGDQLTSNCSVNHLLHAYILTYSTFAFRSIMYLGLCTALSVCTDVYLLSDIVYVCTDVYLLSDIVHAFRLYVCMHVHMYRISFRKEGW